MDSKFFMSVLVPCSILLPVVIGLFKLKVLPASAKIIWYYLLVSAAVSIAAVVIGRVLHANNLPVIHLYTAIEFVLFCLFYKSILEDNSKWFAWLAILFIIFCIINALFFQSIYTYSSYTRSVEALLCLLFSLNYFAKLAADTKEKKISTQPGFYFNCGIFLYMSASFMLFVFSNFIIQQSSKHNYAIIWVIYAALVLCMYLLFSAAFLLCKK
jgi:hypothetical protein